MLKVTRPVLKEHPISSGFGKLRTLTIHGREIIRTHNGIDFKCPQGTPIYAVMPGQIHTVGYENDKDERQGYGYRIIQRGEVDGKVYWVYYAHLLSALVHNAYFVNEGEYLAVSGNTGASTGSHLHLSIRENDTGKYLDFEFKEQKDA